MTVGIYLLTTCAFAQSSSLFAFANYSEYSGTHLTYYSRTICFAKCLKFLFVDPSSLIRFHMTKIILMTFDGQYEASFRRTHDIWFFLPDTIEFKIVGILLEIFFWIFVWYFMKTRKTVDLNFILVSRKLRERSVTWKYNERILCLGWPRLSPKAKLHPPSKKYSSQKNLIRHLSQRNSWKSVNYEIGCYFTSNFDVNIGQFFD